jgi:uncharacterized protein YbcI
VKPAEGTAPADGLPAEVSRSLESVWARHAGTSPREVETVIMADTVICTIRGGTVEFSEGMIDPRSCLSEKARDDDSTYNSDALAVVEEVTGRQVRFFASRSDSAADVATEIFTLENG